MKVLLFGATGMIGKGVLLECLEAADVELVCCVGRTPLGMTHPKLREIVRADLYGYADMEEVLTGFDACFFCLGTSSVGKAEEEYTRVTYDLTMATAEPLARLNPGMVFIFVSGASTDSSERGSSMWARVKGRTENALLRLPFKAVYTFRPGMIRAVKGVKSKTPLYQFFYTVLSPLIWFLHAAFPNHVVSTSEIGRAMLSLVRQPSPKAIQEVRDIREICNRMSAGS
jgi:uncharacterized protein YbjT (DUF2867 family)